MNGARKIFGTVVGGRVFVPHSSWLYRDEWVCRGCLTVGFRMPYGLKRYQQAETLHFITFSCFHRLPLLASSDSKKILEAGLEAARCRHEARIYAYVLMPEHVHLLMNEPPRSLVSGVMKAWKQSTSRKLKQGMDPFWQARYFDKNIRGPRERGEVIRYIHRNPVKRGLVGRPEDLLVE